MGSLGVSSVEEELTVLVTGFGPFRANYPINPSWEITSLLPDYLPADRPKDVTRRSPAGLPPVRICKLGPVRVSYDVVRDLVPQIWDGDGESVGRKFDLVVHIGMAGPRPHYQIERRGHRDGYRSRDVDGKLLEDEERHAREGEKWIWHGVPHELLTDFDIDDIYRKWVARSPSELDLRISDDPGRYLCDFIYFSSLAHLWKQQRDKKVIFFHVPLYPDEASIQRGVELTLTLIRSIVESELGRKKRTG
ncbi:putative pyroglutamyl peptidase type I [Poronia punctata]|nr:putative pyroglutamyl peptidase type I [Poronia punctata]